MATKLTLYNGALRVLGERRLASLTENRESRRVLDDVWADEGVKRCLQKGQWNFANRTQMLDYSPSIEPDFGYRRAFNKPDDWVRTTAVCEDEFFDVSLLQYKDEAGFWFSDLDTIYVGFVSDDEQYGGDLSLWPANFTEYAESYFALQGCLRITGGKGDRDALEGATERLLRKAKATDAMDEATAMLPPGSWSRARAGNRSRRDRGSRTQLIG